MTTKKVLAAVLFTTLTACGVEGALDTAAALPSPDTAPLQDMSANAKDYFANGLGQSGGDPSVARIKSSGGQTFYIGSFTGALHHDTCKVIDNGKFAMSTFSVYLSQSLAHLFLTDPIQVPVKVRRTNGECSGVVAPYFFQDTYGSNPTNNIYMYYVDKLAETDDNDDSPGGKVTWALKATNNVPCLRSNDDACRSKGDGWFQDNKVQWDGGYAYSMWHAEPSDTTGANKSSYWGFFITTGHIHSFELTSPDSPVLAPGTSNPSDSPNNVTIASFAESGPNEKDFEHLCNANGDSHLGAQEGPQPFVSPGGKNLFVSYSGNSYQSDFYNMGLLQFTGVGGARLDNPDHWTKKTGMWFGPNYTTQNTRPDNVCTNDTNNPLGGMTFGKITPNADGNYTVSTGSNAMVYDTGGTLWNIYGARFHSSSTNGRVLRMDRVAFTGEVPTMGVQPSREGAPDATASAGSTPDMTGIYTTTSNNAHPGPTFKWFEKPNGDAVYPTESCLPSTGSDGCGPDNAKGSDGNPGHQTGVYFSSVQTGNAQIPGHSPTGEKYGQGADWAVDNDAQASSSYVWNYSQYAYFVIKFVGKSLQLVGPADSTGTVSVFKDGNIADPAVNLRDKIQNSGGTNIFYTAAFAQSGFHTVMVMINPQGVACSGPVSDTPDTPVTGNQPQSAACQKPVNGQSIVKLGLVSFTVVPGN